ncbi:MAG: hypothetical protein M3Y81_14300 [Chloroflexota bacterium]|nr:hypothetical protein [Chloroflexota bacterium]
MEPDLLEQGAGQRRPAPTTRDMPDDAHLVARHVACALFQPRGSGRFV